MAQIVRGGGGSELRGRHALREGAIIESGASVATDRRQRARLEMSDGSVLALDRDTEIELDPSPATRIVHVRHGVVAFALAHGAAPATILTDRGAIIDGTPVNALSDASTPSDTQVTVTATDDTTDIEVARGSIRAKAAGGREIEVAAGQDALISASGVEVGPSASRGAGADLLGEKSVDRDGGVVGVGELRARRPGQKDEDDRPLRIASHAVTIRIAGPMARTEIDETFENDTGDDLEGIFRFPVPAGALVDRLALDENGKLEEGAFVAQKRAEKILHGAIANATPVRRTQDDIVWVPGPWRDPALLEWKQGGRLELRIFPLPKHGKRRVVIGYTQTVDASLGLRRYVYPLPSAGGIAIDDFSIDAQVLGADPSVGVHARGYDLTPVGATPGGTLHETRFSPTGDLTIEYALPNRKSELSAWTFEDSTSGGRFVAMALRPHLPASAEAKPRDWAIVVDSGRSAFGERFARASRVAVALSQSLDRRDRVTVLACDVACRRNDAGFVTAGTRAAKAASELLAHVVPDGASDIVAAVRSATALTEAGRELRVVVLSDGRATAGYERPARIAEEVADATPRGAAVLAIPIGSDAASDVLESVARGGGGVVVPYAPGARVSDVVLAIAGAGEGALLREASVELPSGLDTVAPAALPTLRAEGETYVVAKMNDSHVKGDVVLRGEAGGDAFEARYPIDLSAKANAGNAFVPRLFAAKRIQDLERDGGEGARAEAIALSQKFAVPSRFTSLLVLESDAMFNAFGIDHSQTAPRWTGETLGDAVDVTVTTPDATADETVTGATSLLGPSAHHTFAGGGGGGFAEGSTAPAPAATSAAPTSNLGNARRRDWSNPWLGRRPRGRFMRRVFHREATISAETGSLDSANRVSAARAALAAAPDDRSKHRDLARALLRRGALDELEQVLSEWQNRDPLDGDVIALRADALAARGDRAAAVRVLSGVAGSGDPSRLDSIATGAARAGEDDVACALRIAAAENAPDDATRIARAVRCERARGRTTSAQRFVTESSASRAAIENALAEIDRRDTLVGDVFVDASWNGNADVDLAVIDPAGQRLGWLAGRGRGEDTTSRGHEKLAVASSAAGAFIVEVARAEKSSEPVSGFVTVSAFGATRRVPFVLTAASVRVARIDARWVSELVPLDASAPDPRRAFNVAAANLALSRIDLAPCSSATSDGVFGAGSADVTFSPESGTVSDVTVSAPFATNGAGACIGGRLFGARVDPFVGAPRTVTRHFVVAP